MKKLVIVESPSKSKTIKQYLGQDYEVLSSKGHIRDLAISNVGGLGLDIENDFKPAYEVIKDKEKVVKELKKAAQNASEIYLATDPDREGEAISWHLQQVLDGNSKPTYRVIFNEVTKQAVVQAFKRPRKIDLALVSSQETRRILDRIIGFKLSKLLQYKIKSKSAGRVQSAALKIIVDREKEIAAFTPEEYWKVKALFKEFDAELSHIDGKKAKLPNQEITEELVQTLGDTFTVKNIETRKRKRVSKPPFTTSSLQQEASNKLNFSGQRTMLLAQKLYEGIDLEKEAVGLITYMRTDSTRLSQSFVTPTKNYIADTYGKEYVGAKKQPRQSAKSQDAHEAIRPTDVNRTPKSLQPYLDKDAFRLYEMIYLRAVASLMKSAEFSSTTLSLTNHQTLFKARAQTMEFDGYLKAYGRYESVEVNELPPLKTNTALKAEKIETSQHYTQPKPRYTEARLIKEMEDLGIGRPSTYSQTVSTLKHRDYVSIEDKKFIPTEQGMLTIEKLDEFFSRIINVDYTARMETVLDNIASKEEDQTKIISDFYKAFMPLVDKAHRDMDKLTPKETGEDCPKCGKPMVYRKSRHGTFEACSGFPACKYIKQDENQEANNETTGITCPKCKKGEIIQRVARRGRNKGNTFYACNRFPKCKHILSGEPLEKPCPKCGGILIKTPKDEIICDDQKECGYKE